jgi:hypothetical protein
LAAVDLEADAAGQWFTTDGIDRLNLKMGLGYM